MSSSTFVSRQTPGRAGNGVSICVLAAGACSAAVLQADILLHAGTCCLLPARSRRCVPSLQHQQTAATIIVVTVLLGDNHHHCGEQEELRIVDEAPDTAPPCRGHMC